MTTLATGASRANAPNAGAGSASAAPPPADPTTWGLPATVLHDAFWRSRGVHCVRRGSEMEIDRGAELFLLLEPGELCWFPLRRLVPSLTWGGAALVRVRVLDPDVPDHVERVVADEDGDVVRIERVYGVRRLAARRVTITPSRALARRWASPGVRPGVRGWVDLRRHVSTSRLASFRLDGATTGTRPAAGDDAAAATYDRRRTRVMERIIGAWRTPGEAFEGLAEAGEGIWTVGDAALPDDRVVLGPAWIGSGWVGSGREGRLPDCVVGPAWLPDAERPTVSASARAERTVDLEDLGLQPPVERRRDPSWRTYQLVKRALDLVLASAGIVALAPLLLVVAAIVMIEDGWPIFYGQTRQGRGGRTFRCWKFRTMYRDAEARVADLQHRNQADGPQVYIKDDPRVTRTGRVLRALQIDELPQLFNVVLGHMSLVGPRPSPERENRYCPAWRDARLGVRPGITGLWQVERTRAPGEDFREWIRWDLAYVERASLRFDAEILWRTFRMIVLRKPNGR